MWYHQFYMGNKGDASTGGKSLGSGLGSHEPGGYTCSVLPVLCPFCHWVGHDESVCTVKRASFSATHSTYSGLAQFDGTHYKSCGTYRHHLQTTLPTASTVGTAGTSTPPNKYTHAAPRGMTLRGNYTNAGRQATAAAPLGLLHSPFCMLRAHVFLWVALPLGAMLRWDPDPCPHRVNQRGCPVWWVGMAGGPPGVATNIPPPTSRDPTTGLGLSAHEHYTSPVKLHNASEGSNCSSPSWVASQSVVPAEGPHIALGCPTISSHAPGGPWSLPAQGHAMWVPQ